VNRALKESSVTALNTIDSPPPHIGRGDDAVQNRVKVVAGKMPLFISQHQPHEHLSTICLN
jgi:hypothetical protein